MISKINGINFKFMSQPCKDRKICNSNINFGKNLAVDTFQKAKSALSLDDAIGVLYKKMINPEIKSAEVPFTKQGLMFVSLDNMKLKMQKAKIDGKDKIVTFFSHKTDCNTGSVNAVVKMTNDNLDDAVKQLRSFEFLNKLEKMTEKLNDRPDYIDMRG